MIRQTLLASIAALALLLGAAVSSSGSASSTPLLYNFLTARQIASAYTPTDLQTAYDFGPLYTNNVTGAGQTVALIEADRLSRTALDKFDSTYNLPAPSIQETYLAGSSFSMREQGEADLDVEWLHALAPGAAIQIYYIPNGGSNQWQQLASAVRSATSHGAKTLSISLGTCQGGSGTKTVAKAFSDVMNSGVSVFVSSGDSGARPGSVRQCGSAYRVAYPAGDPSVVSVGGTTLNLNADSTIASETGWRLSGGGSYLTKYLPLLRPAWQVAQSIPNDKYRWAPDVSFDADDNTGVSVAANGRWQQVGGTSLGAPAWAAIWALLRQDAQTTNTSLGVAQKVIYKLGNSAQYSSAFHDIVSGSNGKYSAGPGWDAVTGWGSPDVANLATALVGPTTTH